MSELKFTLTITDKMPDKPVRRLFPYVYKFQGKLNIEGETYPALFSGPTEADVMKQAEAYKKNYLLTRAAEANKTVIDL